MANDTPRRSETLERFKKELNSDYAEEQRKVNELKDKARLAQEDANEAEQSLSRRSDPDDPMITATAETLSTMVEKYPKGTFNAGDGYIDTLGKAITVLQEQLDEANRAKKACKRSTGLLSRTRIMAATEEDLLFRKRKRKIETMEIENKSDFWASHYSDRNKRLLATCFDRVQKPENPTRTSRGTS